MLNRNKMSVLEASKGAELAENLTGYELNVADLEVFFDLIKDAVVKNHLEPGFIEGGY